MVLIISVARKIKNFPLIIRLPFKVLFRLKDFFIAVREYFFVLYDSYLIKRLKEPIVFIDLGSNLGQGYRWFSKFYNNENIDFKLFEPNPYCFEKLKNSIVNNNKTEIINCGVGVKEGIYKFYGISKKEGGPYSEGGTILVEQNSAICSHEEKEAINVKIINLLDYLSELAKKYKKIIIKMDIEGAEIDILENLIINRKLNLIYILYVEFHSKFLNEKHYRSRIIRERKIISELSSNKSILYRRWH